MTDEPTRDSLATLRSRAAEASTPAAQRTLLDRLRGDPRRGAQELAEGVERRLLRSRAEARRLSRLFAARRKLFGEGLRHVAGVDEVGVGPLAGPLVAAAVILRARVELPGLDDSKKLTRAARERLDAAIRSQAIAVSIGSVAPGGVDRLNPYHAGLEAMRRAVLGLGVAPDHVLVDARTIPGIDSPQTPIVGGDARDGSIAAASIVAKVHRDAIMRRLHERFPGYGFADHKGYATQAHVAALAKLGPTPAHRRSFAPVSQLSLFS